MVKFFVKIVVQFFFWKPSNWRKGFKAKLTSQLYSLAIRRRAKSCGRNLLVLGPGVSVTGNTTIGDGAGFGKRVKIFGDGPVSIGRRAVLAEDSVVYTQVHDYDHSDVLPFGWGFTYPETSIGDYAWIGIKCIVLPGARIGEGAIVQAGSVVMGVVPPCAIVAGNPAKVIGWRDIEHYNKLKVAAGEKPEWLGRIRRDHPRMFFNKDTWPAVKARAEGPARAARDALLKRCDGYPDNPVCTGTGAPKDRPGLTVDPVHTGIPSINEWGTQSAECALA